MRKQFLLIASFLFVVGTMAWAERINISTARKIAENVSVQMGGVSGLRSASELSLVHTAVPKAATLRNTSDESDYFVFNVGDGQGFVIVAGDDRVRPVLAYSDKGCFDPVNLPANAAAWLEGYQDEIAWVVDKDLRPTTALREEWSDYLNGRTVLRAGSEILWETAQWNQSAPYNGMTPIMNGQHTLTGCVATAMAIAMRYYESPLKVTNPPSKNVYYLNGEEKVETIDYSGNYDWDNMPLSYEAGSYTEAQAEAVARLMWHCGANAKMQYGLGESWAYFSDQLNAMRNVFGFSKSARRIERKDFTWDEWVSYLRTELDQKRLVFYDGQLVGQNGGHAFICDGYTSGDFFHINWGWGGYLNDYFLLTALAPEQSRDFSRDCGMIIGLTPATGSEVGAAELRYLSLECESFPLQVGKEFTISFGMKNVGSLATDDKFDFGLGVVDAKGNVAPIFTATMNSGALQEGYYFESIPCTTTLPFALNPDDRIVPICKTASGEWSAMGRADGVPAGVGMNGYIQEEAGENPVTVNFFYNPYNMRYIKLKEGYFGNGRPFEIQLNGLEENLSVELYVKLKDPAWVNGSKWAYDLGRPKYTNDGNLHFTSEGEGVIQVGSQYIKNGRISLYLNVELTDEVAETLEYEVSVCGATSREYIFSLIDKKLEWVFTPSDVKIVAGEEIPFSIKATNVDPKLIGQPASISLNIEGSMRDEVEVDYVKEDGTREPLHVMAHSVWPDGNLCVTESNVVSNLVEGQSYNFVFRYVGDTYPESGDIQVESLLLGPSYSMSVPFDVNAGLVYEISHAVSSVIISGEMPYEASHSGKDVTIASDGIYVIDTENAAIRHLVIEEGGQVRLKQPLTVVSLDVKRNIPANQWTTFAAPSRLILENSTGSLYDNGTLVARYGYGSADRQEWASWKEADIAEGSAILLATSKDEQVEVRFHNPLTATVSLPALQAGSTFVPGNVENGNWFHFVSNPYWEDLKINGRAYVLDREKNSFELKLAPVIPPFHAYMIASETMMNKVSCLRLGNVPTSVEDIHSVGFRAWSEARTLCFETVEMKDIEIYSLRGVRMRYYERSVGIRRVNLPQGTYLVVCDGTAIKVVL